MLLRRTRLLGAAAVLACALTTVVNLVLRIAAPAGVQAAVGIPLFVLWAVTFAAWLWSRHQAKRAGDQRASLP